jgi:hypothetical protein
MGVYNDLAKKLKSNKNQWSETKTKTKSSKEKTNKSRKSSPDLKSFLKIKSYNSTTNKSFSNFDTGNLLCSGISTTTTTTNFNKTKSRILSGNLKLSDLEKCNNKELSMSSNNLRISAQKFSSPYIEGPEELHYFNVEISQNNKKLAYKFEHIEPCEELN